MLTPLQMVPALQEEHSSGRGKRGCRWTPEPTDMSREMRQIWQQELALASGLGGGGDMGDHTAHSTPSLSLQGH